MTISEAKARIGRWVTKCFGADSLSSRHERVLRLLEEALELAQAEKVTEAEVDRLVLRVFSRPVGEPQQEFSGVILTTLAYSASTGYDILGTAETELDRIEKLPIAHFRHRHESKLDDGTSVVVNPRGD